MDKKPSDRVLIVGCLCIALMEMNAMWHGVNGVFLNISMCLIAGIVGYKTKPELVSGAASKVTGFFKNLLGRKD